MTPATEAPVEQENSVGPSGSGALVGLCTLLSRILGFVRESLTAAVLGVGAAGGALTLAFALPNLFRRLFGEGALTAVFLPVYVRTLDREGKPAAEKLFSAVSGVLIGILSAITALVLLLCLWLSPSWLGGKSLEQNALTLNYSVILFPYLILVCGYALAMAVLNAHGRFVIPAAAPAVQNVVAIAGILLASWLSFQEANAGFLIAWFLLFSGVVQLLMQFPPLAQVGMLVGPRFEWRHPAIKPILKEMLPLVLGLGLVQINLLADQIIAVAFLGEGGNQYISLGSRLLQLPIGIIGISTATVSFPLFARLFAAGQLNTLRFELDRALRWVCFLAVPAAAGMAALALPITQVLFEHGKFTAQDTAMTAPVIAAYAAGIPALCVLPLVARIFYAASDTRTPVRLSSMLVFLNLLLSLILVRPLGAAGIALATTITSWINLIGLTRLLREHQLPKSQSLYWPLFQMLLCAAISAGAAVLLQKTSEGAGLLLSLIVGIAGGGVAYFLTAFFLRMEEWHSLLRQLRAKSFGTQKNKSKK